MFEYVHYNYHIFPSSLSPRLTINSREEMYYATYITGLIRMQRCVDVRNKLKGKGVKMQIPSLKLIYSIGLVI